MFAALETHSEVKGDKWHARMYFLVPVATLASGTLANRSRAAWSSSTACNGLWCDPYSFVLDLGNIESEATRNSLSYVLCSCRGSEPCVSRAMAPCKFMYSTRQFTCVYRCLQILHMYHRRARNNVLFVILCVQWIGTCWQDPLSLWWSQSFTHERATCFKQICSF